MIGKEKEELLKSIMELVEGFVYPEVKVTDRRACVNELNDLLTVEYINLVKDGKVLK